MSEVQATIPQAELVSWDMFLVYLTAFGGQGADHAMVWEVLEELGLAERHAFSGEEMLAIEKAIAARIQLKLACSNDARAPGLLKLLTAANRMVTNHAEPR